MGIRDSLSRLKEKHKPGSPGRKRKRDDTGSGTDGEGVGPVGGVHDGREGGSNVGKRQVHPRDQIPGPSKLEPAPDDREGGEGGVGGGEVSRKDLILRPGVEVAVGSGPSREGDGVDGGRVEQVYPSLTVPSIPRSGKSDGM